MRIGLLVHIATPPCIATSGRSFILRPSVPLSFPSQAIAQILMAKPEQLGVILEAIQNLNAGKMLLAGA